MRSNDTILLGSLLLALVAIALVAFAPIAALPASFTTRIWSIANSSIAIAVVSTFIAAFAGTWGAQLLAERVARRKELLTEIRGTNAAIALAFNIANTYITVKKRQTKDMVSNYEKQCAARTAHFEGIAAGSIPAGTPFSYELEAKTLAAPFSPIKELQKILRDKISPDGKAIVLLTPLIQSIRGYDETVTRLNRWIEELKGLTDDAHKACLYFGLPYAPGRTDERYPNMMKAIEGQTDDCIAFSILIAQSLEKYGDRVAARYGNGAPIISAPKFDKASDLIPDMTHYSDWLKN